MWLLRSPWVRIPPSPPLPQSLVWRDDRVVEGARLEIVCRVTPYRGFESLSLRHFILAWGSSSVGRALGSQSGGRGFDPHLLHHFSPQEPVGKRPGPWLHRWVPAFLLGRARWGVSGALYPQSALAGSNSRPEVRLPSYRPAPRALKAGFHATRGF